MKTLVTTLLLLLANIACSQTQKLTFGFDASGNQVSRTRVCVNCPSSAESLSSENPGQEMSMIAIRSGANLKVDPLHQILYFYPPPHEKSERINLIVRSETNHIAFSTQISEHAKSVEIDASALDPGQYLLFVHWMDGSREIMELIKV